MLVSSERFGVLEVQGVGGKRDGGGFEGFDDAEGGEGGFALPWGTLRGVQAEVAAEAGELGEAGGEAPLGDGGSAQRGLGEAEAFQEIVEEGLQFGGFCAGGGFQIQRRQTQGDGR